MTLDVWSLACGDRDVCEKDLIIQGNLLRMASRGRNM